MQGERRNWPLDLTRVGLLVVAVFTHGLVAVSVAESYGTDEFSRRDWWAFRDAGRRVLDGELAGLYEARPGSFPFLHPPYVASVFAPISRFGDVAFYASMFALQLLGLGVAVFALRRLHRRPAELDVVLLGTLASAPWAIGLLLGQPAGLLLGAWLLGFWAIERDRPFVAGLIFGLCALKPPYVLAPMLYALLSRRPRVLGGIVVSVLGLLGLSLFVGQWGPWATAISRTLGHVSTGDLSLWKQHTLLASLRGLLPPTAAFASWGAIAVLLIVRVYRFRRAQIPTPRVPTLRVIGWLALGTVALSPFAYFYDALLLVLPAAALWLCRESYSHRTRALLAIVAGSTFVAQHVEFFVVQSGTPLVGLLATVWFGLELSPLGPVPKLADHRVRELDGQADGDTLELRGEVGGHG